jgi:hypothetical protein
MHAVNAAASASGSRDASCTVDIDHAMRGREPRVVIRE